MKNFRLLMWVPIGLNLVFILVLSVLFIKLGGAGNNSNMIGKSEHSFNENPLYIERTSLFQELEIPSKSIVFLGDSLTDRAEWAEFFPDKRIINRGVGGDTTEGVLNRLDEIIFFRALDDATLRQIARQKITLIINRFKEKEIRINVEDPIIDLCVKGLDLKREGARGLNRTLEDLVSRPLSRVMIQNPECKVYNLTRHDDEVVVMRGM